MLKMKVLGEIVNFDLDNNRFSTDSEDIFFELSNTLGDSVLTGVGVVIADMDSAFGVFAMCSCVDEDFEIINPNDNEYLRYRLFNEGDVLTN